MALIDSPLNMYYCYIVRCADGTLYTGITTDLKRRVAEHNAGTGKGKGARYTTRRRPVKLVWKERHKNRSSAQRREAQIKRLSRPEKLTLIRSRKKRRIHRKARSIQPASKRRTRARTAAGTRRKSL